MDIYFIIIIIIFFLLIYGVHGFISQIKTSGNYWAGVAQDYKEVFVDVMKSSREKPLKASFYVSGRL